MSADGKVIIEAEIDSSKLNTADLEKKLKSIGKGVSFSSVDTELERLATNIKINKDSIKDFTNKLKGVEEGSKTFTQLNGLLNGSKVALHENALAYNALIKDLIELGVVSKDAIPGNFFANTGNVRNVTLGVEELIQKGILASDTFERLSSIMNKLEEVSRIGTVSADGTYNTSDIQAYIDACKSEKELQSELIASIKTRFAHEKQMRAEADQAEREYKGQITGTLGLLGMINPAFTRLSYAVRQFSRLGKISFTDLNKKITSFMANAKKIGNLNLFDGISAGLNKLKPTLRTITNYMLSFVNLDPAVRADAWNDLRNSINGARTPLLDFARQYMSMGNMGNVFKGIGSTLKGAVSKGLSACASGVKVFAKNLLSVKGLVASIAVGIVGMVAAIKLVVNATKLLFSAVKKVGTAFAKFYDFDTYFGSVDDMIEAYNEMQSKEAALTSLMKSRMAATDAEVQSLNDLISAEEESGVVSKQLQVSAMQQLAAYTSQTSSLETLLPVLNDYVVQMYGVDASEKEAESAAKLFGKAMKGQTETLRRSGYVTEAQADAIKNAGTETERAALLAKYMGERCKNMNDILAQTDAGQQQKLANSMQEVQREFGQAASVLKTTFIPVATQVLAIMARMASYAAALAQSLAKFFGRATKAAASTVSQIEDVAEATEDASSSASKANNTMGIDELNILSDDSSSGGGAGDVVDPTAMDEDTSLIDNMTKSLDEMLAKLGSAYDLGLMLGTKLKEALQQIPWDEIKQKANEAGTAIAEFFNGIIDSGLIEQLGTTIGEGINTIVSFLNGFLDNFNFAGLGTSLANGLENMITTIDWGSLGHMIGQSFIGALAIINNFLESFDWSTIGVAIADFLCGIDWLELLGQVVEFAINALMFVVFDSVVIIVTFLAEIVHNIAESIREYIQTDMSETGNNIVQAMLDGIVDMLKTIVSWVYNHVVVPFVAAFAKYFGVDSDDLHEIGTNAIEGFFNGIKEFIADPLGWIKEHVVDPIINAFKELFGINSPSTVMTELGGYVIEGLYNGIMSLVENVKQIWENLKTHAINIWNTVKTQVVTIVTAFKTAVVTLITALKTTVSNLFTTLKTKIVSIVTTIKTNVVSKFTTIKTTAVTIFTNMKTAILSTFTALKTGIKNTINGILSFVEGLANGVVKGINTVINALNNLSIDVPDWVADKFGIDSFGFNIPTLSEISIPKLATGAVLPANNPFLAVVGDQTQGTNIEAPLETIQDAVSLVLQPYLERLIEIGESLDSKDLSVNIGDKEIAQANIRGQRQIGYTLRTS